MVTKYLDSLNGSVLIGYMDNVRFKTIAHFNIHYILIFENDISSNSRDSDAILTQKSNFNLKSIWHKHVELCDILPCTMQTPMFFVAVLFGAANGWW